MLPRMSLVCWLASLAWAVDWVGGDYAGADLVLQDGDTLTGDFTGVGLLWLPSGATATLGSSAVSVSASRIVIDGRLVGVGVGHAGGRGGVAPCGYRATDGEPGDLGGDGGVGGVCDFGGGGGGGGHGGAGGRGAYSQIFSSTGAPLPSMGGLDYGLPDPDLWEPGGGGGGGGSACVVDGALGGTGGGGLRLEARWISVDGQIDVSGASGGSSPLESGAGGGGAGGTVVLLADRLRGVGTVFANGGRGGDADSLGANGGGGGGGGGFVTVEYAAVGVLPQLRATGGTRGAHAQLMVWPASNGVAGQVMQSQVDADRDGVHDRHDELCIARDDDGDGLCDTWDSCGGAPDLEDRDGDTVPDACDVCPDTSDPTQVDADLDGRGAACDCDDLAPAHQDLERWYDDRDRDGDGDPLSYTVACVPPLDTVLTSGDCDDRDPTRSSLATEVCNGVDDNCANGADEPGSVGETVSWPDDDLDTYGADEAPVSSCVVPAGNVLQAGDCDDLDGAIHPGVLEFCDGVDEDCDGEIDLGAVDGYFVYTDLDEDGHGDPRDPLRLCTLPQGYALVGDDCDDTDPTVFSGSTWYADRDGDELGDSGSGQFSCAPVPNRVLDGSDCDDTDPNLPTTLWPDTDGDAHGDELAAPVSGCPGAGLSSDALDCDDGDDQVSPDGVEVCNDVDDDCDDAVDDDATDATPWYVDADEDGWGDEEVLACDQPGDAVARGGDCDDGDGARHPEAVDLPGNGVDEDCSGADADATLDSDGDGLSDAAEAVLGTDPDRSDTDGDGVGDADEAPDGDPVDTDGDGTVDALDPDDDGDDLPTRDEGTGDTDGDGIADYLDTDADGDGVFDLVDDRPTDPGRPADPTDPPAEPSQWGCGCDSSSGTLPSGLLAAGLAVLLRRRSRAR